MVVPAFNTKHLGDRNRWFLQGQASLGYYKTLPELQMELQKWDKKSRQSQRIKGKSIWDCRLHIWPFSQLGKIWPVPIITHLDGCKVLKVTMWVGDEAQGAVPLGGRVNPNLIVLVSSEEPGSIQAKTGWQNEKLETEGTVSPWYPDLLKFHSLLDKKGRRDQSDYEQKKCRNSTPSEAQPEPDRVE